MHRITFDGLSYQTYGELPNVGSRAPDVSLVNTDLQDVSLANFMGKRKVFNIFPSIDTPVCAKSVVAFDKLSESIDDVAMLMISYDLPFAHARFQAQHDLQHVVSLSAIRHAGFGENYGVQVIEGPLAGTTEALQRRRSTSAMHDAQTLFRPWSRHTAVAFWPLLGAGLLVQSPWVPGLGPSELIVVTVETFVFTAVAAWYFYRRRGVVTYYEGLERAA